MHFISPRYRAFLAAGAAGALLLATGCSTPARTQQAMDGPQYPAGYSDGCASARESAKPFSTKVIQDQGLYRSSPSYATGWRQGFTACKTEAGVSSPEAQGTDLTSPTQPF